jgi:hypothetical protein
VKTQVRKNGLTRLELNRIMHQTINQLQKILSYIELEQSNKAKDAIRGAEEQIKTLHGLTKILLDKIDDL